MPAPKVAVVIPARHGSTRFPGKPLFPIAGKPLIQHVWERCGKARGITAVIVATDDMRVAEAAFDFGAEVSMTSPKHRSGTDRCAEVAKRLRGYSHIINVQGDEPLIEPALVTRLAKTLTENPALDMITAANAFGADEVVANPNSVKVVLNRESDALYFSRSAIPFVRGDGVRPVFYRHQGIYGYSLKFLLQFVRWKPGVLEQCEQLEQLRALENGARIRVVITKSTGLGVDAPEDVAAVERRLARR
ncbi:MAG: 3-deoxy-manno-octulosonate cytidylyltransferase [Chthoniobacter sp.]|nr:3-deoxy-manno-octulosonate cytidylyltransferase [Chthoniobacter sp.]